MQQIVGYQWYKLHTTLLNENELALNGMDRMWVENAS